MSRGLRRFTGPQARRNAVRYVRAMGASSLYPRPLPYCTHPRWTLEGSAVGPGKGHRAACFCTAVDEPDRRCSYVTWQHASIHRDGADYLVSVGKREDSVIAERPRVDGVVVDLSARPGVEPHPLDADGDPIDMAEDWRERDEPRPARVEVGRG